MKTLTEMAAESVARDFAQQRPTEALSLVTDTLLALEEVSEENVNDPLDDAVIALRGGDYRSGTGRILFKDLPAAAKPLVRELLMVDAIFGRTFDLPNPHSFAIVNDDRGDLDELCENLTQGFASSMNLADALKAMENTLQNDIENDVEEAWHTDPAESLMVHGTNVTLPQHAHNTLMFLAMQKRFCNEYDMPYADEDGTNHCYDTMTEWCRGMHEGRMPSEGGFLSELASESLRSKAAKNKRKTAKGKRKRGDESSLARERAICAEFLDELRYKVAEALRALECCQGEEDEYHIQLNSPLRLPPRIVLVMEDDDEYTMGREWLDEDQYFLE